MKISIEQNRDQRRRSGVTLVEMMIAMVILSFGLLGVAALQVRAITEGSGGRHLSTGSAIARNQIELLNRVAWDDASLDHNPLAWSTPTTIPIGQGLDQAYQMSTRVTWDDVLAANVQLKAIEVRVTWSDEKRQNRQVLLSSARLREVDE